VDVEEAFQQRPFGRPWRRRGAGGDDNINVYVLKLACDCIKWSGSFIPLSMMKQMCEYMDDSSVHVWVIILVLW